MLRLAELGVTFSNGYAASSVCSPSRAALLTGKTAPHTGITDWIGADSNDVGNGVRTPTDWVMNIPASEVLLPEAMRASGYATAFFGKWHMGQRDNQAADPLNHGFDINIAGSHPGSPNFAGGYFAGGDGAWANMPGLDTPGVFASDAYLSDAISERAAAYIRGRAGQEQPFFALVSHYVVHTPITAPTFLSNYYQTKIAGMDPELVEGHTNATYAAMVHKMDQALGRVLDALEDPDGDPETDDSILDDTVFIFTADNGGKAPGGPTSNRPLRAGKGSLYEGGIREPLIVAHTGNPAIPRGTFNQTDIIAGYDIYPTILHMAGVEGVPAQNEQMDGVTFLPALTGRQPDRAWNRPDLFFHFPHRRNDNIAGGRWTSAIRRGDHKLVYFFEGRRFEYYDLASDVSEANDLYADDPFAAASMSRSLYRHLRRVDAPNPRRLDVDRELPGPAIIAPVLVDEADAIHTDLFETAHDFKAGTAGTGWDGSLDGADAALFDAGITNPGALTFRNSAYQRFIENDQTGAALYKNVTGDFEAVLHIRSMTSINYNVLGVFAADPNATDTEFLWIGQQDRNGSNDRVQARNIVDGVRLDNSIEVDRFSYFRLAREGDTFVGFFSADGVIWVPFVEYDRPDLPETVRVGVFHTTSSTNIGTGVVESFQIIPGAAPDLAQPTGVIDTQDILRIARGIVEKDVRADIARPYGMWDINDLIALLRLADDSL